MTQVCLEDYDFNRVESLLELERVVRELGYFAAAGRIEERIKALEASTAELIPTCPDGAVEGKWPFCFDPEP